MRPRSNGDVIPEVDALLDEIPVSCLTQLLDAPDEAATTRAIYEGTTEWIVPGHHADVLMKSIPTVCQLRSRYEEIFETSDTQKRRPFTWQQALMWFCARPVAEASGRPCWFPVEKQLFRAHSASIPVHILLPGRDPSGSAFDVMQLHMAPVTTSTSWRHVEHNQTEATLRG